MLSLEAVIYLLCVLTSGLCAWLLSVAFRRRRQSLLLWSALCFGMLTVNNLTVLADMIWLPDVDLSLVRALTALAAGMLLLWGFVQGME
jgi:uncharacterized protein DUF5985